ncbi:hypothetical protein IMZ31_05330 [Pontibacillus sp. ALD_SL1]|uniref:hypothetical protein n=1 Tax=Pontibacillus sp. ALD_SL1 TaxID=2777185 RepID=UPI001A960EF6|nr:hypothetical protein [Pontibacillus sp. ALD_SL1]QST00994.1 hypothetical protein IMZ31_05330 [Pontibacillus sp. ALD_SL1]
MTKKQLLGLSALSTLAFSVLIALGTVLFLNHSDAKTSSDQKEVPLEEEVSDSNEEPAVSVNRSDGINTYEFGQLFKSEAAKNQFILTIPDQQFEEVQDYYKDYDYTYRVSEWVFVSYDILRAFDEEVNGLKGISIHGDDYEKVDMNRFFEAVSTVTHIIEPKSGYSPREVQKYLTKYGKLSISDWEVEYDYDSMNHVVNFLPDQEE